MNNISEPQPPSSNERLYGLRTYVFIAGVILTPLASAAGAWITSINAAEKVLQESNVEYVKLAIEILQTPDSDRFLTAWALEALSRYTNIEIDYGTKDKAAEILSLNPAMSLKEFIEKQEGSNSIVDFTPQELDSLKGLFGTVEELT